MPFCGEIFRFYDESIKFIEDIEGCTCDCPGYDEALLAENRVFVEALETFAEKMQKERCRMKNWVVKGYAGFDDCDGPSDYNFSIDFKTSDNFTKSDIQAVVKERYKNKRTLEFVIYEK